MKENEDKNIEQYVHAAIKETPLETPSHNFTANVMASVLAMDKSKVTVYKPLISKLGWVIIFGGIIATLVYFIINGSAPVQGEPWSFGPGVKGFIRSFSEVHLFQVSRITVTIAVLAMILMLVQITLLKNYLDKRVAK